MANITEVLGTDVKHKSDFVRRSSGDRDLITGLDNFKEALLRRLITVPGSLIHRPQYGVGIKLFLGSLSSLTKQRELAVKIEENFKRDPRVDKITGISVSFDDRNPSLTYIIVRVRPVGYDEVEMKFEPFGA